MDDKFNALEEMGAGDFAHLNGALSDHLIGTYRLLKEWDAREILCQAGLFHAAYGTAGFSVSWIDTTQRNRVAAIVGENAESIIYMYCACDRHFVWPQISREAEVTFRDRFTGNCRVLSAAELHDFCELTVANELEIASRDGAFIVMHGKELLELFGRMEPYLSVRAVATAQAMLGVS